jgi:hypothetical protein
MHFIVVEDVERAGRFYGEIYQTWSERGAHFLTPQSTVGRKSAATFATQTAT